MSLLFGFFTDRTDTTGSIPSNGIPDFDPWLVHRTILLPGTQRICGQSAVVFDVLLAARIFGVADV
jgi:hypothetical protein